MSSDDLEGDDIWGDAPDAGGSGSAGGGSGKDDASAGSGGAGSEAASAEAAAAAAAAAATAAVSLEDDETRHMTESELRQRIHLLNNDIRVMKSDVQRITHESRGQRERIRENQEKVKVNKQLPYLVANIVEVLEPDAEDGTCRSPCNPCNSDRAATIVGDEM
jgi:hypothetical protein